MVINAVTKSGTNQLRATGFGFLRDSDLGDAKNFITNKVEPFHEKQMDSTAVARSCGDRLFFFASYEYQSRDVTAIPHRLRQLRRGGEQWDHAALWTTFRADAQLGRNHRLFARTSTANWEQLNVGVGERNAISNGYSRPSDNRDLSLGDTWVMSDRMVNEIRAGFSAIDNKLVSNSTMPLHTFPSIVIGSPTNSPQWWKEFNTHITDTLSYFVPAWHGEHNLKTGFQFFRPDYKGAFPSDVPWGGRTSSPDPGNPDDPSTYPAPTSYSAVLGDPSYAIKNATYGVFFKDDWTVSPRLTLNLGIRHDVETGTVNTDLENPGAGREERRLQQLRTAPRIRLRPARRRTHRRPWRLRPKLRQGAAQHLEQRAGRSCSSLPPRPC